MALTQEEQEVHLNQSADDPNTWYAYTDYPKWARRFEKIGAELVKTEDGGGTHWKLDARMVLIRAIPAKRELSPEHLAKLRGEAPTSSEPLP